MKKDYIVELNEEEADELMDEHWVGELVRCKDCENNIGGRCKNLDLWVETDPEWFCADGKRKEQPDV